MLPSASATTKAVKCALPARAKKETEGGGGGGGVGGGAKGRRSKCQVSRAQRAAAQMVRLGQAAAVLGATPLGADGSACGTPASLRSGSRQHNGQAGSAHTPKSRPAERLTGQYNSQLPRQLGKALDQRALINRLQQKGGGVCSVDSRAVSMQPGLSEHVSSGDADARAWQSSPSGSHPPTPPPQPLRSHDSTHLGQSVVLLLLLLAEVGRLKQLLQEGLQGEGRPLLLFQHTCAAL